MFVVTIMQGDLTEQPVDAVVNAANEWLLGGGGVDGAIHRAAGPALLEACREIPEVAPGVRCPTGDARITPGFGLPAKFIIHTVGPVYDASEKVADLLAAAFRSSLTLAVDEGLKTVAFPAISCGVYGYPAYEAAAIAASVVHARPWPLQEIRFVLYTPDLCEIFREAFDAVQP